MAPDKVDQMLEQYRANVGRCKYLELKLKEIDQTIENLMADRLHDFVPLSQALTGMPRKPGTSDTTGKSGSKLADGDKTDFVRQAEVEREAILAELESRRTAISLVDAWITGLKDKERFVIEKKVMGGISWSQLVNPFHREFGCIYSVTGLRRIKNRAMQAIYQLAV